MSDAAATQTDPSTRTAARASRAATARVHRFEVWPREAVGDPRAQAVAADAARLGLKPSAVSTARVYLIEADLSPAELERVRAALLTNPVVDDTRPGVRSAQPGSHTVEVLPLPGVMDPAAQTVEDAVRELTGCPSVRALTGVRYDFQGLTRAQCDEVAARLLFNPAIQGVHAGPHFPEHFPTPRAADQSLRHVTIRGLSDDQLSRLSRDAHLFLSLDEMKAIQSEYARVGREPTDIELETLAQTWSEHCVHKTLKSRIVYREAPGTGHQASGPNPRPDARSLIASMRGKAGHTVNADGSVTIDNLLKRTVAAATFELIEEGVDWTLSVFKDNSGVIRFDDQHAVNIKVETHNHPSAIEPYGGAATGVGGCIRDVIATGLGAQPIANTDVFCVAYPDDWVEDQARRHEGTKARSDFDAGDLSRREGVPYALPKGVLPPRRVLTRVVDGVRDYGNRMGIPTVSGAVYFDNRYVGNPLVFCGCIGLMRADMVKGEARPGDRIIALGGRTGRDGIHGATFSSAELTDTHADEFSHAVQIGNAIEEKRTLDAIMRARDFVAAGVGSGESGVGGKRASNAGALYPDSRLPIPDSRPSPLFHGLTDCGAGGFSSAVGEMGSKLGAEVHLERAPLKYAGLRYDEIWISESQERFVLAVPPENVPALQKICDEEGVLLADLGHFGTPNADLILNFHGKEVGRLSMHFLHEGIPMPTREAVWQAPAKVPPAFSRCGGTASAPQPTPAPSAGSTSSQPQLSSPAGSRCHQEPPDLRTRLLQLLAHPNIASKRWIVRQYDHEVRGNTVIKPLVGPGGIGPGDATVLQPVPGSKQGLAIACGMAVHLGDPINGGDPYEAALAAVDECVRNLVCVGADPDRIAILDNFCWPSCGRPDNLASLVRAAEGCYDAAKAYRTPFVSGKDSLNNQLRMADGRVIEIPPTLLITGMGIVPDVSKCVTMDLKAVDSDAFDDDLILISPGDWPRFAFVASEARPCALSRVAVALAVSRLIRRGLVLAAHDVSEGGPLVAVAEMLIASGGKTGAMLDTVALATHRQADLFRGVESGRVSETQPADSVVAHLLECFREEPGSYVLQVRRPPTPESRADGSLDPIEEAIALELQAAVEWCCARCGLSDTRLCDPVDSPLVPIIREIGRVTNTASLEYTALEYIDRPDMNVPAGSIPVSDLRQAFLGTLNW